MTENKNSILVHLVKIKIAAVLKLKIEQDNENTLNPCRGYALEIIFELIVLQHGWLIKRQEGLFPRVFTLSILSMLWEYWV